MAILSFLSPMFFVKRLVVLSTLAAPLWWTACGVPGVLDPVLMAQHLQDGKPILGTFWDSQDNLARWMSRMPDSVPIESLSIPGTHDTSTWNYTGPDETTFRTQDRSIFDQLNSGIRFLDIRFGLDENTNVLRVYHADALLSSTASLEDVLWGLYYFLDHHPTETLLVSLKVDHGSVSVPVQEEAHTLITGPGVSNYWVQNTTLPSSLGAVRGKIILFRRFGFDTANNPDLTPVGLNVATGWADNNADFSIVYTPGASAYIEDLYQLNGDAVDISPQTKVQEKFDAITTHLTNANGISNITQVFITFASGFGSGVGDILSPRVLAEGNSTISLEGINARMDAWLSHPHKKRLGIILYDFFQSRPDLVRKTIGHN